MAVSLLIPELQWGFTWDNCMGNGDPGLCLSRGGCRMGSPFPAAARAGQAGCLAPSRTNPARWLSSPPRGASRSARCCRHGAAGLCSHAFSSRARCVSPSASAPTRDQHPELPYGPFLQSIKRPLHLQPRGTDRLQRGGSPLWWLRSSSETTGRPSAPCQHSGNVTMALSPATDKPLTPMSPYSPSMASLTFDSPAASNPPRLLPLHCELQPRARALLGKFIIRDRFD